MASEYNDENLPEPDDYGHSKRTDCNCELCKYERFVYVLDRFEAEQTQKEWDERGE